MIKQDKLEHELKYVNKLNRLLSKQSDKLADVLRFYANGTRHTHEDNGQKARQVLKEWYDL
jgi:hypothetical protein